MGGRLFLAAAAVALLALASHAQAGLCPSEVKAYGRAGIAPGVVAPAEPLAVGCLARHDTPQRVLHTLPPGTDQIALRLFNDHGSQARIFVELDGLGWKHQKFQLERVLGTAQTYYMLDWVYIPDPKDDERPLRISAKLPGGQEQTLEYRVFPVSLATQPGP